MVEPTATDPRERETELGPDDTPAAAPEEESSGPVIRDRRRIDPETGRVREPEPRQGGEDAAAGTDGEGGDTADAGAGAELATAQARIQELVGDLQRLQAEYVNYRRRVERDRSLARDLAVAGVMESLLPVLDDLHLARQHGDLESGPFAAIADKLETTLGRFGLVRYGEAGETFDPTVHDALMHTQAELAEGTTDTTVVQVMQPGYRCGDRLLRAARVAVADPS